MGQPSCWVLFIKFWWCLGIHGRNSCVCMVVRLVLITAVYLRNTNAQEYPLISHSKLSRHDDDFAFGSRILLSRNEKSGVFTLQLLCIWDGARREDKTNGRKEPTQEDNNSGALKALRSSPLVVRTSAFKLWPVRLNGGDGIGLKGTEQKRWRQLQVPSTWLQDFDHPLGLSTSCSLQRGVGPIGRAV